jgi:diguanylate cyclase (GGDEF)-like protein
MPAKTVLLLDPQRGALQRLKKLVDGLGYATLAAEHPDDALRFASQRPDVVLISDEVLEAGESSRQICRELRSINEVPAPVVVLTAAEHAANGAAEHYGADGLLARPLKREVMAASLKAFLRVRELGEEVQKLKAELASREERLRRASHTEPFDSRTNFYHFEFFKRLLVIELRRAKRYDFPLALLLIAIDPLPELARTYSPGMARDISEGVALAISRSIRDIDIPVHYADNNILVMLPHTDGEGSDEVAQRIADRIKRSVYHDEASAGGGAGLTVRLTASIGVASFEPGTKQVSFARLIRDASLALRAAQAKGGNQVVHHR